MKPFIPADLRALLVHGPDASGFIQSQVTLDLDAIQPNRFYPAAWCDPKGRALCVMLIACDRESVMLVMPRNQVQMVAGRLKMFSIGHNVEIAAARPVLACIQLDGDSPESLDTDWYRLNFDARRAICVELVDNQKGSPGSAYDLQWQEADLAYGFPWLSPATSGRFIPQMLGLETLEGLSYRKGCYPGQEVIARVHYRGKVSRKTIGFEIETTESAQTVTALDLGDHHGVVLYALNISPNIIRGLAVVPTAVEDGRRLNWKGHKGHLSALKNDPEVHR